MKTKTIAMFIFSVLPFSVVSAQDSKQVDILDSMFMEEVTQGVNQMHEPNKMAESTTEASKAEDIKAPKAPEAPTFDNQPSSTTKEAKVTEKGKFNTLTPEEERFFREKASLQQQLQLMEARVKLAEQQAKYNEIMSKMMESSKPLQNSQLDVKEDVQNNISDIPDIKLVSVYGKETNLVGDVFYRGGRFTVKKGDVISDGWRVTRIKPTSMVISKNGQRVELELGSL